MAKGRNAIRWLSFSISIGHSRRPKVEENLKHIIQSQLCDRTEAHLGEVIHWGKREKGVGGHGASHQKWSMFNKAVVWGSARKRLDFIPNNLSHYFATPFSRGNTDIELADITLYQWHQDILLYDLFGYLVTAELPDNANR